MKLNLKVIRDKISVYLWIIPAVAFLLGVIIIPLLYSLYMSFVDWSLIYPNRPFVGLGNYQAIFDQKSLTGTYFVESTIFTFEFALGAVALSFIIGLGLALLFNKQLRGVSILRSFIILPLMVSYIVMSITWRWLLNYDFGLVNWILWLLGFERIAFLSHSVTAKFAVLIAGSWWHISYMFVMLLAGLQAIPVEMYEASKVDGAGSLLVFRDVTLPMLKPIIFVALILNFVDACKLFATVYGLTVGGPGHATYTITYSAYTVGFHFLRMGQSSAMTWVLFIIVAIASIPFLRFIAKGRK